MITDPTSAARYLRGIGELPSVPERSPSRGPLWTVIDFKTDSDVDAHGARYEVQVSLYVDAIERATGERATGILLAV